MWAVISFVVCAEVIPPALIGASHAVSDSASLSVSLPRDHHHTASQPTGVVPRRTPRSPGD
ncbi:hypothetical protein D7D52_16920 [Nocardia yunnanensis]|uniref:Uncharacterized protein n=1 Tax=Nocardia yunnanensis TaxID=2382165 RepID=A0A386ZDL2_9NOCA|nr:hypothetical protein D7D52_16920 [Nocardia yunnanensis]